MATGLVLMGILELLRSERWVKDLSLPWLVGYYGVLLAMPLGMLVAAGLWGAVAATGVALLLPWGVHRLRNLSFQRGDSLVLAGEEGTS
jgi:hypothetical protein